MDLPSGQKACLGFTLMQGRMGFASAAEKRKMRAVVTAMLPACEKNLAFGGPSYGKSFAGNDQWMFTAAYSRAPHATGTPEKNGYFESTLKPCIRQNFLSWVTVTKSGA